MILQKNNNADELSATLKSHYRSNMYWAWSKCQLPAKETLC